jgi:hypothetical protein
MSKYLTKEPYPVVVIGTVHYLAFAAYDKTFYFKDYAYGYTPSDLESKTEEQLTDKATFILDNRRVNGVVDEQYLTKASISGMDSL